MALRSLYIAVFIMYELIVHIQYVLLILHVEKQLCEELNLISATVI